jgi:RNA polymerase sigma factor (sigma-70 family)
VKRIFTSDESIIRGIQCSDDRALAQLYKEYADMVGNLVRTNSGTGDDADDIFQDAIIILYEKIKSGKFVLSSSLKTFIYSISRNLWLYRLRQMKKNIEINESLIVLPEDETGTDNFYEEGGQQYDMMSCIRLLGESCRKILLMFYYDKLSTKEIAVKLNLAGSDYVKTQKYRCLQKLKSFYQKSNPEND